MPMFNKLILYCLIVIVFLSNVDTYGQDYKSNLDDYNDSIKTIAIMPFRLFVGRNGAKTDTTAALEKDATIKKSYLMQQKLSDWLPKNIKHQSVSILEASKTDSLLRKTKLSFDALLGLNAGALCKYLGVDAIAYCEIKMSNPDYKFSDVITEDLVDAMVSNTIGISSAKRDKMNNTTYAMRIVDNTGKEVWRHAREIRGYSSSNNADKLFDTFNYYISNNLPFLTSSSSSKRR